MACFSARALFQCAAVGLASLQCTRTSLMLQTYDARWINAGDELAARQRR